eukprot:5482138-Amphidinium_carterae.1
MVVVMSASPLAGKTAQSAPTPRLTPSQTRTHARPHETIEALSSPEPLLQKTAVCNRRWSETPHEMPIMEMGWAMCGDSMSENIRSDQHGFYNTLKTSRLTNPRPKQGPSK